MKNDRVYLEHIREAISDIEKFTTGISQKDFLKNKEKQYAVSKLWRLSARSLKN